MTNAELVEYYVNLLIIQYKNKAKAEAHVQTLMEQEIIFELIKAVESAYNIDDSLGNTAQGVQLNVIAKYVGAERVITGIDFSRIFFGGVDYNEPTPYVDIVGSIDYSETDPPDAQILTYETDEQSALSLTDQELLLIIQMKILQNNSNHSVGEIDDLLDQFFGDSVIFTDEKNMTISYIFDTDLQRIVEISVAQMALPKPASVGLNISFVSDIENIMGSLNYSATEIPTFLTGSNLYSQDTFGSSLTY